MTGVRLRFFGNPLAVADRIFENVKSRYPCSSLGSGSCVTGQGTAKPGSERRSRLGLQMVAGVGIEPTTFGL